MLGVALRVSMRTPQGAAGWTAFALSRGRLLGILTLALTPVRLVVANYAASRRARPTVMTRIMAGDAADYGALDATLGPSALGAHN